MEARSASFGEDGADAQLQSELGVTKRTVQRDIGVPEGAGFPIKVRPAVEKVKLNWYSWHAFRRGLGTNLNQLGVEPKDIQAILRHSD
jgi:hypothetical protein